MFPSTVKYFSRFFVIVKKKNYTVGILKLFLIKHTNILKMSREYHIQDNYDKSFPADNDSMHVGCINDIRKFRKYLINYLLMNTIIKLEQAQDKPKYGNE